MISSKITGWHRVWLAYCRCVYSTDSTVYAATSASRHGMLRDDDRGFLRWTGGRRRDTAAVYTGTGNEVTLSSFTVHTSSQWNGDSTRTGDDT